MTNFNEFCKRFLETLNNCNVPVMPLPGVDALNASVNVACDYENSVIFFIADGYQKSIGFTSLIAYLGYDGYLKAVRLTSPSSQSVEISKKLGMIYGATYYKIEDNCGDVVYYI